MTPDQSQRIPLTQAAAIHAVYHRFEDIAHLRDAWNDLAARVGDLFCSYDWCEIWWRCFGRERQLEIHTLHDGDRLVAVLPLFRETLSFGAGRLRVARLVASDHTLDAVGLAIEPEFIALFVKDFLDDLAVRGWWDILHVGPMRSYVTAAQAVAHACTRHPEVQAVLIGRQNDWLTVYELPQTYEQYLQSLQGDERRDTQRRRRKLEEQYAVQIQAVTDPREVRQAMDALVRSHQDLWTGKGQRGQFVDWPGFENFHRQVAQRMAEAGQLLLVTLTVDGKALGAAYGYHFGPRSHAMIRGYPDDDPWRRFALGRLLHCHMVRQAIGRGSVMLDDGRGVFDYKLRLGGQLRGEQSLTIVRRGWSPRLRFWMAMRTAYLIHVLYCRLWFDRLAPRLGLARPLRRFYIRRSFLAQLFRRTRFRLFGESHVEDLARISPPQSGHGNGQTHQEPA